MDLIFVYLIFKSMNLYCCSKVNWIINCNTVMQTKFVLITYSVQFVLLMYAKVA